MNTAKEQLLTLEADTERYLKEKRAELERKVWAEEVMGKLGIPVDMVVLHEKYGFVSVHSECTVEQAMEHAKHASLSMCCMRDGCTTVMPAKVNWTKGEMEWDGSMYSLEFKSWGREWNYRSCTLEFWIDEETPIQVQLKLTNVPYQLWPSAGAEYDRHGNIVDSWSRARQLNSDHSLRFWATPGNFNDCHYYKSLSDGIRVR